MEKTIAGKTIDTTALPKASIAAMVSRGLNHYFGNEVSSKVATWKSNNPDATEEAIADFRASAIATAWEKLEAGTVGVQSPRGPSVTPEEKIIERLAKAEVKNILDAAGIKFPKGDETVELNGEAFTADALIERRIAKHGERLAKEAEAEVKRLAREKAKREAAVAETGLTDL